MGSGDRRRFAARCPADFLAIPAWTGAAGRPAHPAARMKAHAGPSCSVQGRRAGTQQPGPAKGASSMHMRRIGLGGGPPSYASSTSCFSRRLPSSLRASTTSTCEMPRQPYVQLRLRVHPAPGRTGRTCRPAGKPGRQENVLGAAMLPGAGSSLQMHARPAPTTRRARSPPAHTHRQGSLQAPHSLFCGSGPITC